MSNICLNFFKKTLTQTNVFAIVILKEGVIHMKKKILSYGGLILFYSVISMGVLLLNMRFSYLNEKTTVNYNEAYMAVNK